MMARGHAASGMAVGAACASWGFPAVGFEVPGGVWATALLGTILAGWSLAPDIDTERATASTAFGPLSKGMHHVAAKSSYAFTKATGTSRDEPREHRGLTHSGLFVVAMFAALTALGQRWPEIVSSVIFAAAIGMLARLRVPAALSAPIGIAAGLALFFLQQSVALPGPNLIAAAAALGCLVHQWGDWITRMGIPFAAPFIKVKGKRWWNFRPPLFMTFKAGSGFETFLILVFFGVTIAAGLHSANVI
jgi:membrane-bound metal-dependent hydrolase YbcI (DUF457 family)